MIGEARGQAYSSAADVAGFGRGVLASPTCGSGDGVGYVGMLLSRALSELTSAQPDVVSLGEHASGTVALGARLRFASRMLSAQVAPGNDFVVYNHVGLARVHRWLPVWSRLPYAVFVHGVEVWDPSLAHDRVSALSAASVRIANSEYTARRVRAVHPGIGAVVPCPLALMELEPPSTDQVDHSLLARLSDLNVLIIGRMSSGERYKGHDELLEAWPVVVRALPEAQLVIAGTGDDVERLRLKAASLGVGQHVLFCGRVSESTKLALLQRTSLFAMPSRGEGFGIVYLEAMRAARACLGCVDDGASAVIADGSTGVLLPDASPGRLAVEIIDLLRNEGRRRALGEAGARRFHEYFTFPDFRDRFAEILRTRGNLMPRRSA